MNEINVLERLNLLETKYEILRLRQQTMELDLALFVNDEITQAEYIAYSKEIKRLESLVEQLEKLLEDAYKLN
jgi:hypothetical protein